MTSPCSRSHGSLPAQTCSRSPGSQSVQTCSRSHGSLSVKMCYTIFLCTCVTYILSYVCSILLFALSPGYFQEPDHRCFERLARVASKLSNGFASIIPEAVRVTLLAILGEHPDTMAHQTVASWWDINERTAFFRHPQTARVVRHMMLTDEQAEANPGAQATRRRWRR
jgi:hypothetical protein